MITEDYVTFKTAKLLKEKGFDGMCDHYDFEDYDGMHSEYTACGNWNAEKGCTSIPSLALAMKWLREIKHIHINVRYVPTSDTDNIDACFVVDIADDKVGKWVSNDIVCGTYEEAAEAALKYSLENLI